MSQFLTVVVLADIVKRKGALPLQLHVNDVPGHDTDDGCSWV